MHKNFNIADERARYFAIMITPKPDWNDEPCMQQEENLVKWALLFTLRLVYEVLIVSMCLSIHIMQQ